MLREDLSIGRSGPLEGEQPQVFEGPSFGRTKGDSLRDPLTSDVEFPQINSSRFGALRHTDQRLYFGKRDRNMRTCDFPGVYRILNLLILNVFG